VPLFVLLCTCRTFRQVLANLVSNALKFTRPGGDVRVVLRFYCGHDCVVNSPRLGPNRACPTVRVAEGRTCALEFTVSDTGPGIAPDVLPKLFQSYEQGKISTSREYGGTGYGLVFSGMEPGPVLC
jgi:signal transduction histidine kinase